MARFKGNARGPGQGPKLLVILTVGIASGMAIGWVLMGTSRAVSFQLLVILITFKI